MTPFDAERDLEISRLLGASPAQIWRCWTDPALLRQWWAPRPVEVIEAGIDPRPGGRFHATMRTPDGTLYPVEGAILDCRPEARIVFSDCLRAGWRPAEAPFFTAEITFAPEAGQTRYTARVMHARPEDRERHVEMGFRDGWSTAIAQLDELALTV